MQIKLKSIKKTLKILGYTVLGIILFLLTVSILLENNKIQNFIANKVTNELSSILHTKVSIDHVNYQLFNVISIKGLYIEDLEHKTLLKVAKTNAHFNFFQLFKGRVIITSVELDELYGNLVINKKGVSNLDFILKALKDKKKTESKVIYRIADFKIKNSTFNYTNQQLIEKLPSNIFNANKIRLRNLNVSLSLNLLNKDSLNAKITKLNFTESSGLRVSNLSAHIFASKKITCLTETKVSLPNSELNFDDIKIKYDSLPNLNQFAEKVKLNIPINTSNIAFSDLSAFIPDFKKVKSNLIFKGLITGRISSLHFKQIEINYGKNTKFKGDLEINGLPHIEDAYVYGKINQLNVEQNDLQDLISDLTRKPFLLPDEFNRLGHLEYKGNLSGFMSNLVAYGKLSTNLGEISADLLLKFDHSMKNFTYDGTIKTTDFRIGNLIPNSKLGKVTLSVNIQGSKTNKLSPKGLIYADIFSLDFNNYNYKDINIDGEFDGKGYNGTLDISDKNINAHFDGKVDLTQTLPVYDFDLKINNTNLNALKLIKDYEGSKLSFSVKTNMVGKTLDDINGYVRLENILFSNKNKTFNLDRVTLVTRNENKFTYFAISSDIIKGTISGNFLYSTLSNTINGIVEKYLPAFAIKSKTTSKDKKSFNHLDIDLKIENTHELSKVLELPYTIDGSTTVKGYVDEKTSQIFLKGNLLSLKLPQQQIDSIQIHLDNFKDQLQFITTGKIVEKDGHTNLFFKTTAIDNSLEAKLIWQNSQKVNNAGEISAVAKLNNISEKFSANLLINPSQIVISDSIWNLHSCNINLNADSTFEVHNFKFERNNKQFVQINGIASKSRNDSMTVKMNDLNLDFIMNLLKLKGVSIGGNASGKATMLSLLNQPIFEAGIAVKDFSLNHKILADVKLKTTWDKIRSQMVANGTFVNRNKDTVIVASGVYTPKTDTIDIMYDAKHASLEFLSTYFGDVVENFKAYATGKIRMFGPLKLGVTFEGDAFVSDAQATVSKLRTTYHFNDSVHLTTKSIEMRKIKIYDQENNPGILKATITHNGLFQHLKYNMVAKSDNILGMNTRAEDNEYFFGKAYAKGTVRISGDEKEANISVQATSRPKTKCYTQMGGASSASDNSFIKFVSKKSSSRKKEPDVIKLTNNPSMNVKIDLQVDVTTDAEMELIVDPKAGDMIEGTGTGNLRVQFDSYSPVNLYGTYTINNGNYLFTLQNVIRKEFKIDKGSTIDWTGNPFGAKVNIRALYPLTASLSDLMDEAQLKAVSSRSTIPVNCVLKLTDDLMKPTVNFEIDLPSSDDGVKQLVKSIINTNEMMNKQMIYLLVFSKFFTPEYMRTYAFGLNDAASFGLTTVSAQVNSWFSKMINSNSVTLGVDYKKMNISSMSSDEYKAQILYQPNNRLMVNGNFGYRNDNISQNRYINDVDIEYMLNKSGKLRGKIYNHTVDVYYLGTATNKEGISLMYKEDFTDMSDMFRHYLSLAGIGKKKKE